VSRLTPESASCQSGDRSRPPRRVLLPPHRPDHRGRHGHEWRFSGRRNHHRQRQMSPRSGCDIPSRTQHPVYFGIGPFRLTGLHGYWLQRRGHLPRCLLATCGVEPQLHDRSHSSNLAQVAVSAPASLTAPTTLNVLLGSLDGTVEDDGQPLSSQTVSVSTRTGAPVAQAVSTSAGDFALDLEALRAMATDRLLLFFVTQSLAIAGHGNHRVADELQRDDPSACPPERAAFRLLFALAFNVPQHAPTRSRLVRPLISIGRRGLS
jgi:hypothetical protein